MSLSHELREAVDTLSIPEQVDLLQLLPEDVTTAVHTGWFTEETMEKAFFIILAEAGVEGTEEDLEMVYEAIDEFVEEELELFEKIDWKGLVKGALKKAGGAAKEIAKEAGKEVAKDVAGAAAKKLKGIKTKSKTGKMLKHAAAGAVKQIGKDPGKAKEILKRSAKKAGKKLVKRAAKKGMKMVFGKWVKIEAIEEAMAVGRTSYDVPGPRVPEENG